jgi:hypothetical protein
VNNNYSLQNTTFFLKSFGCLIIDSATVLQARRNSSARRTWDCHRGEHEVRPCIETEVCSRFGGEYCLIFHLSYSFTFFYRENGASTFFRNLCKLLPSYMASYPAIKYLWILCVVYCLLFTEFKPWVNLFREIFTTNSWIQFTADLIWTSQELPVIDDSQRNREAWTSDGAIMWSRNQDWSYTPLNSTPLQFIVPHYG